MKSVATTDFCLTALIADKFFNYATWSLDFVVFDIFTIKYQNFQCLKGCIRQTVEVKEKRFASSYLNWARLKNFQKTKKNVLIITKMLSYDVEISEN